MGNKKTIFKNIYMAMFGVVVTMMVSITSANAVVIYSNDFETDTNGFSTSDRGNLPTNTTGGSSQWLGGGKSLSNASITLTLTGLTVGSVYDIVFDLYLGGTWDGSGAFGPDYFKFNSSSDGFLINATFVNDAPVRGTDKTQTYSDATPLGDGGEHASRSGMDVERYEAIYYFGHGAGNPLLSFTASGMTEFLTFSSSDMQGSSDEFFAIDNMVISGIGSASAPSVPEPAPFALLALGLIGLGITRKR